MLQTPFSRNSWIRTVRAILKGSGIKVCMERFVPYVVFCNTSECFNPTGVMTCPHCIGSVECEVSRKELYLEY